jgi:DNA-binding NtrC family response regulator
VIDRIRILLVDEDPTSRRVLAAHLARGGDEVESAEDARTLHQLLSTRNYDVMLCESRSLRVDLVTLVDALRQKSPNAALVLVSAFATVEQVTAALRQGVYDYLLKPVEPQHIASLLVRVRERKTQRQGIEILRESLTTRECFSNLMHGGPAMEVLHQQVRRAAATQTPVLVIGEDGTGRTLVARAIHAFSDRSEQPMVVIDCARDPAMVQAELLGAPSSPTSAISMARGGTLVLKSVTRLSHETRARVLQAVTMPGAPRVIATSEGVPSLPMRKDNKRTELLVWVRNTEIITPTLRERREDISRLTERFVTAFTPAGQAVPRVAPEVMAMLIAAPWNGNLRELESSMRHASAQAVGSKVLTRDHLSDSLAEKVSDGSALVEQVEAYERAVVRRALENAQGAVARAAVELGVPERTLRRKMRQFGIAKEVFRKRSRYKHLPVSVPRS